MNDQEILEQNEKTIEKIKAIIEKIRPFILQDGGDLEYVGLLGYVSKVSDSVIEVSFYYAKEKGQNAFVTTHEFLRPELYFVGTPNQDLLPC